jgi:hypothetical protein
MTMDKQTKYIIREAISTARKLSGAEIEVARLQKQSEGQFTEIEKQTGLTLYQNSLKSTKVFWRQGLGTQHRDSIEYANEEAALFALLNSSITWDKPSA